MHNFPHRLSLCLIVLMFVCSCNQSPAQVMLRGGESFANHNAPVYSVPARPLQTASQSQSPVMYNNVQTTTNNTAPMQSVMVTDLAPPSKTTISPSKPVQQFTKVEAPKPAPVMAAKPVEPVVAPAPVVVAQAEPLKTTHATSGFIRPVEGKILKNANDGVTFAAAEGEPVYASADGEVAFSGNGPKGYGNMIILKHADNKNTAYSHLSRTGVYKYDRVKQGDIIGYVGSTGNAKASQLHFAIREGTKPLDPNKYLSSSHAAN